MASVKSNSELSTGEIYMVQDCSGYHDYYSFGTDYRKAFKHICDMYNVESYEKHTLQEFIKICHEDGHEVHIFKVPIESFYFGDDYNHMLECYREQRGITYLGEYFEFIRRRERK